MAKKKIFQVAEIGLVYKRKFSMQDRPQIKSSKDAYQILVANWSEHIDFVEEFNILLLNRANRVLGIVNISKGGVSGTVADPKIIFAAALRAAASSIILSHNHPSGTLRPSQADIDLTRKLKSGGEFLDIVMLDHLIITSAGYHSFADEGLI